MLTQAIEKINTEMQKNPNDKYTEIIGHYLIDRCADGEVAKCVVNEEKSLKGAMEQVLAEAKKKKQGSVAILMPSEVFGVVDQYFGISTDEDAQQNAILSVAGGVVPTKPKEEKKLALSLADFL